MLRRLLACCLSAAVGAAAAEDWASSWRTAPPLTDLFPEEALCSAGRVSFAALAGGVSAVPGREGGVAVRWANHPRFPTAHSVRIPSDWSQARVLAWPVFSARATNERLLVAVRCDNPATHAADFRVAAIRVDWSGWRVLRLPLDRFVPLGDPGGWDKVSGLYLFTKVFHWQPHPATDLVLDEISLQPAGGEVTVPEALPVPPVVAGIEVTTNGPPADLHWLNHGDPEARAAEPLALPLRYEPYFLAERASAGYFPRFVPGPVSADPAGRLWILAAGTLLQTCDAAGRWQTVDLLREVVAPYALRELGFRRLRIANTGQLNEGAVRFDADGDMYVLVNLENPDGDWRTRTGLLLHGRGEPPSWTVYRLPWYMARFEKLTGHNPDALRHPPVLLLTRYHAPNASYLLVPEKRPDGSLRLPEPLTLGDDTIGFLPHSGEASQALSLGESIFVVYGRMAVLPGRRQEDGVPAYIVRYDRGTRTLSDPVFMGTGGRNALDNHNWPTIAADSQGILHVIINGHHDPFRYVHSLVPGQAEQWSPPESISAGTTYAGLVVGPDDTLYSVSRCSDPGYRFRMTLHRKRPGGAWEQRHLVEPFKPYYHVWFHKLAIEPRTGRLFLSYLAQSVSLCLFRDELEMFVYQRPDLAAGLLGDGVEPKLPLGTDRWRDGERRYAFYGVPGGEPGTLVSDDGGDAWRLAVTADFLPPVSGR